VALMPALTAILRMDKPLYPSDRYWSLAHARIMSFVLLMLTHVNFALE